MSCNAQKVVFPIFQYKLGFHAKKPLYTRVEKMCFPHLNALEHQNPYNRVLGDPEDQIRILLWWVVHGNPIWLLD